MMKTKKKYLAIIFLVFSCANQKQGISDGKVNEMVSNNTIVYFKDFDIFRFQGTEQSNSCPAYPFVEYEKVDNKVRLKFCLNKNTFFEDTFFEEKDCILKSDTSDGDGEWLEFNYLFIKNEKIYNFQFLNDSLNHKGKPTENFLDLYSVFDEKKRITYVLKTPYDKQLLFNPKINSSNLDIKIPEKCIYSKMEEYFELNQGVLKKTERLTIYGNPNTITESTSCFDIKGLSIGWFYYLGDNFKKPC